MFKTATLSRRNCIITYANKNRFQIFLYIPAVPHILLQRNTRLCYYCSVVVCVYIFIFTVRLFIALLHMKLDTLRDTRSSAC